MEPRTFATPNALHLELRIPAGEIQVDTADIAETTVEIRGERDPDDFRIELTDLHEGGHRLVVEQSRRRAFSLGWTRELRVRVLAPFGASVQAETGSADLGARGKIGALSLKSGSGDVAFDVVEGNASVKVASGDVEGNHVFGDLSANSASGDIRVDRVDGEVVAHSASGDVSIDSAEGPVRVATASGDVKVGGLVHGEATLRSVSGDIDVSVARGTRLWMDLSSVSGDTVSELAMGDGLGGAENAALELRATSVSGDIRLRSDQRKKDIA